MRNVPERLLLEARSAVLNALVLMVIRRHFIDFDAFLLMRTIAVVLLLYEDGWDAALLAHSHGSLAERQLGCLLEVHPGDPLFGSAHVAGTLIAEISLVLVELHDVDALLFVFAVFVFLVDLNRLLGFIAWYLDHLFNKLRLFRAAALCQVLLARVLSHSPGN